MRVVISNLHAGVDGWGRPTEALTSALALEPDILICPELWRGDEDMVATLTAAGYHGHFADLTGARRVAPYSPPASSRRWQPWTAHLTGERGIYYGDRPLTIFQRRTQVHQRLEEGRWGLGLYTRLPLLSITTVPLGRLPRERVTRVAIVARLESDHGPVSVTAVHGAHLSHGSPLWFARLRRVLATFDPHEPAILGGDFNAWTPVVRILLSGWRPQVRARTWPSPRPHSQIDHIVTRGSWRSGGGGAVDGGSDHLALYADLTVESS